MTKPSSSLELGVHFAQRPFAARRAMIPPLPRLGPPALAQSYPSMLTTRASQNIEEENYARLQLGTVTNRIRVPLPHGRRSKVHTHNALPSRTPTPSSTYPLHHMATNTERLFPYINIPLLMATPLPGRFTPLHHRVISILPTVASPGIHREISSIVDTHSPGSPPGASPHPTTSALVVAPRQTTNTACVSLSLTCSCSC